MFKSKLIIISLVMLPYLVQAQYLKVDNGAVFSSFVNGNGLPILSTKDIFGYSMLLGYEFKHKNWYYLSSQVGYLTLGGREINTFLQNEDRDVSQSKGMVNLNTLFKVYKTISDLDISLGVGPYVNIIVNNLNFDSNLYGGIYYYKRVNAGGRAEIGVSKDINRFLVGISGGYNYNVNSTASSEYIKLKNNSYFASISLGYKIGLP